MLDYAKSLQVPVWTPVKLLDFIKARDNARFENIEWNNDQLVFDIFSEVSHTNKLTVMVPFKHEQKKVTSLKIGSSEQPFSVKKIKGNDYAMFSIKPGTTYQIAISYTQ